MTELSPKTPRRKRGPRPPKRFSVVRLLLLLFLWGAFSGAGIAYNRYAFYAEGLPDLDALDEEPELATLVYSADGELIGEFYLQKRVVVPFDRIPEHVRQAFISAEDRRFWDHPGFDILGIARAAAANFSSGATQQGASTITQQLTRMILLSNERTLERKIRELILAIRVDRRFSKREILERYLNRVYLGHGAHGVQAAAEIYFGKDVDHLTIAEGALLAGLVQRPTDYSPHHSMKQARGRQSYVIERMRQDGYISDAEAHSALRAPLGIVTDNVPINHVAAPYFVEHIRLWAQERFGTREVFNGGLRIYTTLDMRMQRSAEAAVRDGLDAVDRKVGFRGPMGHLNEARLEQFRAEAPRPYLAGQESAMLAGGSDLLPDVRYVGAISDLPRSGDVVVAVGDRMLKLTREDARHLRKWRADVDPDQPRADRAVLQIGDLIPVELSEDDQGQAGLALAQVPEVEAAMVAIDPHSSEIRALVGGYDYRRNQFNRATQGNRQIGSAIKPFLYATAIAKGMSPVDIVLDAPITLRTTGGLWSPGNYDGKFLGSITLRTALAKSLNTVAVRLIIETGVEAAIETIRTVGITSPIPVHPSIALGTPDLTLLEVAAAYATFANGGKLVEAQDDLAGAPRGRFINLVTDAQGHILADYRGRVPSKQVISPGLAYVMVDMLKAPVERGTAKKAQALGRPAAGKTGTATQWKDAWFMGFTADLMCGVWIGRDDSKPIGYRATGGTDALPIWLQFMQSAHPEGPPREFPIPDDVTLIRVNDLTGAAASPGVSNSRWIPFLRGRVPARYSKAGTERFKRSGQFDDSNSPTDVAP